MKTDYKSLLTGKNNAVFGMPKFLFLRLGSITIDLSLMILLIMAGFARNMSAADSNWGLSLAADIIWWGLIIYAVVSIVMAFSGRPPVVGSYSSNDQTFVPMWYARVLTVIKLVLIGIIVYSLLV